MAKKASGTPLTERELLVLAAVFARSNMGMDRPPQEQVQRYLTEDRDGYRPTLSGYVLAFCEQFMETDEHQRMFEDEAKSWYKDLKKYTREKIAKTWPDMAELVWPSVPVAA